MKSTSFWVVTSYYNPAHYRRRIQNYQAFRRHLNLPLLAIELAEPGHHQLAPGDADTVIRVTGNDRIWQKERLLNIAISTLPKEAEFVAWVDCDVIFSNPDWAETARSMLGAGKSFVQLFDTAKHLPPEVLPGWASPAVCRSTKPVFFEQSFASAMASKNYFPVADRPTRRDGEKGLSATGLPPVSHGIAWAGHRGLLQERGLYDACVIGGGDRAVALAGTGYAKLLTSTRPMTDMHTRHYLSWAERFKGNGEEDVGFVPGTVFHLWHGRYERRHYEDRHKILRQLAFNPHDHLEMAENGTWRWAQHATDLETSVGAYFFGRLEDQEQAHAVQEETPRIMINRNGGH